MTRFFSTDFLYNTYCIIQNKNGNWTNNVFALCRHWHCGIPLYDLRAWSEPNGGGEPKLFVRRGCFGLHDYVWSRIADLGEQGLILRPKV